MNPAYRIGKFHLSLNVGDLPQAVAFYRVLFQLEPTKFYPDYAKFELVDPPVIMSLVPRAPVVGTQSCGFGLRMPSRERVLAERERLEKAGLKTQTQECTRCGYAEQLRVHVGDPDGNYWALYAIDRHVDPAEIRQSEDGGDAIQLELPERSVRAWEHFATHPLPERIPHADASLDEVRLLGTFNQIEDAARGAHLVREAARVLRPGGGIHVSGLMADKPFPRGEPVLKNVAIAMKRIAIAHEVHDLLSEAGFVGIEMQNAKESTRRFQHDGVWLGETHFRAVKPDLEQRGRDERVVFYKGPFASTRDDLGNAYRRGERTRVDAATWELLRRGAAADQFVFFDPRAPVAEPQICSVD